MTYNNIFVKHFFDFLTLSDKKHMKSRNKNTTELLYANAFVIM